MNPPAEQGPLSRKELHRERRNLILGSCLITLLCLAAAIAIIAYQFSEDRQSWNDGSLVLHTHGTVVEEVPGRGSCKGQDFDTRLEWTQDGETRTGWASTCRSGPDLGDRVEMWTRSSDGKIVLTEPSTTVVLGIFGALAMLGMATLSFFSFRFRIRATNKKFAEL